MIDDDGNGTKTSDDVFESAISEENERRLTVKARVCMPFCMVDPVIPSVSLPRHQCINKSTRKRSLLVNPISASSIRKDWHVAKMFFLVSVTFF